MLDTLTRPPLHGLLTACWQRCPCSLSSYIRHILFEVFKFNLQDGELAEAKNYYSMMPGRQSGCTVFAGRKMLSRALPPPHTVPTDRCRRCRIGELWPRQFTIGMQRDYIVKASWRRIMLIYGQSLTILLSSIQQLLRPAMASRAGSRPIRRPALGTDAGYLKYVSPLDWRHANPPSAFCMDSPRTSQFLLNRRPTHMISKPLFVLRNCGNDRSDCRLDDSWQHRATSAPFAVRAAALLRQPSVSAAHPSPAQLRAN